MGKLTSWLSGFTKGARKLLPFIRSAVADKVGATNFYNFTRDAGIGANKKSVLRMYREVAATYKDPSTYFNMSSRQNKPIPELIPRSLGPTARSYSYELSVVRTNPMTGLSYRDDLTIASNRILSLGEAYDMAGDMFDRYEIPDDIDITTLEVNAVTYSAAPIFRT